MYQPHLNVNWATYHMGPSLPTSPGFFLSPGCGPSVLPVPSKFLCSPVGTRMRPGAKPPATTLIPALMAVHPSGQRAPIIGLSPVIRGPPPPPAMIQRGPPLSPHGPLRARNSAPPSTPTTYNSAGNRSLEEASRQKGSCSKPTVQVVDLTEEDTSVLVGRKRSASPTDYERRLKRQREVSRSPELSSLRPSRASLVTPEKRQGRGLHNKDIVVGRKLSHCIEELYNRRTQTEDWMIRKMNLWKVLYNIIKTVYPRCGLYMVGSSMTGLASNHSDLDLCLVLSQSEINQQTEAIAHLREVQRLLHQCDFIRRPQLIFAKVPILKFTDEVSGVDVDLNINSVVGIRNTQLINNYALLDERVGPLCLTVKLWAKFQDINDPYNKTLSSYSLILMVLHYLQVGCDPPVLPCLQKLMPNHFSNTSDVRTLSLKLDLPSYSIVNKQCLGELLIGFLHYYGHVFNFQNEVISVRVGGTLAKDVAMNCRSPKNKPSQWNFICIEEPFDRTNTASSVFDKLAFNRIRNAFSNSLESLRSTPDLGSILSVDGNS